VVSIEVTVKSINYRDDYDMYAVEVMFHHETKTEVAKVPPPVPDTLPDDMKALAQMVLSMMTPQRVKVNIYDDMLTGTIYLTEDQYTALGRFGVGSKLQLGIDIGKVK